jgi:hypothetical protein
VRRVAREVGEVLEMREEGEGRRRREKREILPSNYAEKTQQCWTI